MQRFFLHLLCFVLVLSSSIIGATVPSQYIVYAVDTCKIGDRAGTTGSGLIGSAKLVSIGSDAVINGDIYSAGTINLFDRAIVNGSVTAKNSINKSFGVVVNGTTNPNTNVVSYTIPTKSFTTGTTNVFVPLDSTKVIVPGNYGDITISARSTVTFSNGIYNVKSLIIDNDVKVKLDFPSDGKIEFNSSGTLTIGDRVVTTFLHNNNNYAVNYYSAGTATVRVGFDGTAYGNIVAPNALVIIHRGTQFTGTVYAKKIELQPSVFYEADVVAPNLRITYPVNGTYSSSRTPRVVVMYTDDKAGLDISTLRVYINGADRTSLFTLNGDSAVWQIPSNYKLPEGQNTIAADVKDRSANLTHAEVVFKVDESKPVIAFVSPVNGTSSPIDTPLVSVSFSDQLSGINKSGFIALLDGCNVTSQFTLTNTTAIYQMRLANKLSSGTHTFSVSISDSCGNVQSASSSYTVNKPPVTVAITTPANGSYTNQNPVPVQWSVNGIEQTTLTTQTLVQGNNVITRSFTDQYGTTGTASVNITLDTQAPIVAISSPTDNSITNQSNATVTWTVDGIPQTTQTTATLTEGVNTITRSVTDAAGNTGTASVNVTLDAQSPVVAISTPLDNSLTNQSTATVAWTIDEVAQTTQTCASLTEGANTITRSVTDAAGNTGTASVNVTLDTQAPVVAISSPVNNSITNQSNAIVAWTVDGVPQTTETTASLTEGANTITRSVTDAAGNTGTASINVTLDTQAPVVAISSPTDNSVTTQNTATVVWTVDGIAQTTQTTASLTEGANTITRSVTDAAGNTGTTSVNVTLDTQAPVVAISSPANNSITNNSSATVSWTVDGINQTTELTQNLVEGSNTITRSFTDVAGNTGTASVNITLDTQAPVVAISSPLNNLITNQATINVEWNVGGVTQTTETTASLIEGANTITRSVTDAAGNTGTASVNVTLDTQAPAVVISSPAEGTVFTTLDIAIVWSIDGITQTTQNTVHLITGNNAIIRTSTDAAGNIGADTVHVTLANGCITIANTTITIDKNDFSYENRSLCISNSNVIIEGYHTFDSVRVTNSTVTVDTGFTSTIVELRTNSVLAHKETNVDKEYGMRISSQKVDVDVSSKIDASGRGYLGDQYVNGNWIGAHTNGNAIADISSTNSSQVRGGSYGGQGSFNAGYPPIPAYGNALYPVTAGSGGGAYRSSTTYYGGDGGGVISLTTKYLKNDGIISANGVTGSSGYYNGEGAGGSILITTDSLVGTGKIESNGGTRNVHYSGGGGRVYLDVKNANPLSLQKISAIGALGTGTNPGTNGTVVVRTGNRTTGRDLYVTNSSRTAGYATDVTLDSIDTQSDSGNVYIWNSGLRVKGNHRFNRVTILGGVLECTGNVQPGAMSIDSSSTVTLSERLELDSLKINANSKLIAGSELSITKLELKSSSTLTHKKTTVDTVFRLAITSQWISVDSTSVINANGLGYIGDQYVNGNWIGARTSGNTIADLSSTTSSQVRGGSHGGQGSFNPGYPSMPLYGNAMYPVTAGGGGGVQRSATTYYGGDGGGIIFITTMSLRNDGIISANGISGNSGYYNGDGAGGSILITTDSLTGAGKIESNGGTRNVHYSGGGGRVYLDVKYANPLSLQKISAIGALGTGTNPGTNGTVVVRTGNRTSGRDLYVTNSSRVAGYATNAILDSIDTQSDSGNVYIWNSGLRVKGNHRFNRVTVLGGVLECTGNVEPGAMSIDSSSTVTLSERLALDSLKINANSKLIAGSELSITKLELKSSSTLAHKKTTVDSVYRLTLTSQLISIDSTSAINANGLGYLGDQYINGNWIGARTNGNIIADISGTASNQVRGGSHGGRGASNAAFVSMPIYGSEKYPVTAGGGGGVQRSATTYYGGDGGGIISITTNYLKNDGKISANGLTGSSGYYNGDGAGGSILITADSLIGSGKIECNGGAGNVHYSGGGGRIAVYNCLIDSIGAGRRFVTGNEPGTNYSFCSERMPDVQIVNPMNNYFTNKRILPVTWSLNGIMQTSNLTDTLDYGENKVIRSFRDPSGYYDADTIRVVLDTIKPKVTITSPLDSIKVGTENIHVEWSIDGVRQTVENQEHLVDGINLILRSFTDSAGNYGNDSVFVMLDTHNNLVKITQPVNGDIINYSPAPVKWYYNDTLQTSSGLIEYLKEGVNVIRRSFVENGFVASDSVIVNYQPYKKDLQPIEMNITGTTTNEDSLTLTGSVNVTLINNGSEPVNTPFTVIVFEDRNFNQMFDSGVDSIFGTTTINSVGIKDTITSQIPVLGKVLFVNNLLYAYVDNVDTIKESDEGNNTINSQTLCINTASNITPLPQVMWTWDGDSLIPQSNDVEGTPVVVQLNDDNSDDIVDNKDFADIVFFSEIKRWNSDPEHSRPYLRAINGKDGTDIFVVEELTRNSSSIYDTFHYPVTSAIAAGDIDNNGRNEIIVIQEVAYTKSRLACISSVGNILWYSDTLGHSGSFDIQLSLADLNADGATEIVAGSVIFNNKGKIINTIKKYLGSAHELVFQSYTYDINMDNKQEILNYYGAFNSDGKLLWNIPNNSNYNTKFAFGNFDDDIFPEIVCVKSFSSAGNEMWLLENDGSIKWGPVNIQPAGYKGVTLSCSAEEPVILDVNNDGVPEIGLNVFDEVRVYNANGTLLWNKQVNIVIGSYYATLDGELTSTSVIDFNNDNNDDLVYQAVDTMYIFDGKNGNVLFKSELINHAESNSMPLFVDIDNDNSGEIICTGSATYDEYPKKVPGIVVYEDVNGVWPNARKIWNQKAYCKTNINDDGTIPPRPEPSWLASNTFGENKIDKPYGCMDLNVSFLRLENPIAQDSVKILARIGCKGSLNAPPDLNVAFYEETDTGRVLIDKIVIQRCLQPGEYLDTGIVITDLSKRGEHRITVVADDDGTGFGRVREPDEFDNVKTNTFFFFNKAPVIIADTMPHGDAYKRITFQVQAYDPDTHAIKYRLAVGEIFPRGEIGVHCTIDSLTGIISALIWPDTFELRVQVKDQYDAYSSQDFQLVIDNKDNHVPEITSQPITVAQVNQTYSYQVIANDPDSDPLYYSLQINNNLQTPPIGMVILPNTGLLTWTPGDFYTQRNQPVIINVSDRRGGIATQQFTINLAKTNNHPPYFNSVASKTATQRQGYSYTPVLLDEDSDPVRYWLQSGPSGMRLNETGTITFTPEQKHVGTNYFTIRATDGYDSVNQRCTLIVANVNDTPVITSNAISTLTENSNYTYAVIATDADNDPLNYQLVTAPAGMTISSSGTVTWNQKPPVGSTANVLVRVSDPSGANAEQTLTISVIDDNVPPSISIFTNPPVAKPGDDVVIAITTSDDAGVGSLNLTIDGTPVSMINNEYVYHCATEGFVVLAATAVDSNGNSTATEKQLLISNSTDNTPPTLSMTVGSSSLIVDQPVTVTVTANDDIALDTERVWLFVNNVKTPLVNGVAQFTPSKQGNYVVRAAAYDMAGNYKDTLATLFATYNGMDVTPPVAELVTPDDTTLYTTTEITGTASDDNFAYYTLRYILNDTRDTVEFIRSESPFVNGTLGTFDPSTMENGAYQLLLTVYDKAGNGLVDKTYITVDGQLKTGIFTLAFEDLSFQLPGVNCQSVRTYDSRNKAKGDFGFGWTLDIHSVKLTESCKPGDFWSIRETKHGQSMPSTYSLDATRNHTIHIAMPGGRTQSFKPEARFFGQYNPTYGEIVYTPDAGTFSKLEALDAGNFYIMGGILYDEGGNYDEPYNPQQYKLTLLDGTSYIIDQNVGGVTKIEDPNNNHISITEKGITHSAGQSIVFTRDSLNRISQINDNTGRVLQYFYDGLGNLSKVIDPAGAITRFKYNQDHYLQEIIDPRGVRAARVEYDTDGRMIRQINPAGDTVLFTHDMDNNREVVSDFRGNETEYTYDNRGNVLTKTDAAGNEWEYTYDQHDNVVGTVDPYNHQKSSTFDTRGNELTSTDELNRTVTRTYTVTGQIATEVDALNRTSRYDYDTRGNLLTVTGPDNVVTGTKTYDAFGNVLTEKDALGFLTKYTYDNQGRMVSKTDPTGRTSRFVLDIRGNTVMEINPSGDTTRSVYDIKGNLIMSISPTGDSSRSVYNVFGKVARQIDIKGNVTVFEYDIFGQLKRTIAPDSTFTEKEYDADGNAIASIDETGRRNEFEYDFEKRVTRTIAPDKSSTRTVYDRIGRRTASIDAKRFRTEYEYDAAGNNTIVRDPYGNQTTYIYDNANRKVEMIDALNQHTSYAYDEYDRLVRTTFDDNTYTETSYDANGRKTAERDQQGNVTQFAYDSLGNLVSVTDAMNHVTRYTYDSNNNRISQTDANNHVTTMEYDRYNRMTKKTYPGNGQERFGYDISGAMLYKVSGNDSTVYTYDNRNREILRTFTSGHTVRTTYIPDGRRDSIIDYRGVTMYEYDSLTGQLTRTINPDSSWIEYAYDVNRNRVMTLTPWDETRYTYDSLNRMKLVIQGDDTTQYFYNTVGNRDSVANANGTSTAYRYDRLNRLLSVTNYDATNAVQTSYTYTLNSAGMRTQVSEHDGSVVDYTYDESYKLTAETRSGTHPYSISYTYDNVGNRLSQVKDGITTTYTYNNRDQLLDEVSTSDQIHYTYDNSGRMATKTSNSGTTVYSWIDDDRLETIVSPNDTIRYTYDADNMRVASVASNSDKLYLIDKSLPYGQVIAEYDSTGSLKCGYVYGLERICQRRGDIRHYYVADGQGSIRTLTDTAGTITDTYFYTAFGEEFAKTGTTENEFRYVGEQWDPNAGFYYLRARWYDQSTGRFASVDPFAGDPQAPVSLHRYLYANASPLCFRDPSGRITLGQVLVTVDIAMTIYSIYSGTIHLYEGKYTEAAIDFSSVAFWGIAGARKTFKFGKWWYNGHRVRSIYNNAIREIDEKVTMMQNAGKSIDEIADAVVKIRNNSKVATRALMDAVDVAKLEARNLEKYGNSVGPTLEQLLKKYGSYEEIIEASTRTSFWYNLLFLSF